MDATEFTDLIRRHAGLIHKIAYAYCRDATDREDVVQEIAVALWRARERYDERYRQTTWIYRIALNVAISFYRRERRHRDRGRPLEEDALVAVAPVEPADDVRRLLAGIDGLGALEKALVLLYLDGNDHALIEPPTVAPVGVPGIWIAPMPASPSLPPTPQLMLRLK